MSSSNSISSPGWRPSRWITSRASLERLKDVLRLDDLLPGPPPPDDALLVDEKDVRRDGGPDSPSVAATELGENERWEEATGLLAMAAAPLRSRLGMSAQQAPQFI